MIRIGVDVGGTNTDAVLMRGVRLVASHKTPSTRSVTGSIVEALRTVLRTAAVPADEVGAVVIGTTQLINAVVERTRLTPVAALRIGLPSTDALPPMVGWPADLRAALGGRVAMIRGGCDLDGRPLAELDERAIATVARELRRDGFASVAVTSVFSPVHAEMEQRAAAIIRQEHPEASLSLSHEIGRIGLLERENAAIINACLRDLARTIVASFREALRALAIGAPLYLSQNDGTLMGADFAEQYPVLTFASGPTNSMRGAAFLSGLREAMVVDIGGTTSDVGMLVNGFPREASAVVEIGGVRTNFRMPDLHSFALGGGSLIAEEAGRLSIGPRSVGYDLSQRGLVFGGDSLTATDIAVAAGLVDVGDRGRVRQLSGPFVARVLRQIAATIAEAVEAMRTTPDPLPLVAVGGGSILLQGELPGVAEVLIPEHSAVANAIGATISLVGGEVDQVVSLNRRSRAEAIEQVREAAITRVVSAGAHRATVRIVDLEEVPLSYLPGNAVRLRAKAVGEIAQSPEVA